MSDKKEEQGMKAIPSRMVVEIHKSAQWPGQFELRIEILVDQRYVCVRVIPPDFFKTEWDYLWDYVKREMEAVISKG